MNGNELVKKMGFKFPVALFPSRERKKSNPTDVGVEQPKAIEGETRIKIVNCPA